MPGFTVPLQMMRCPTVFEGVIPAVIEVVIPVKIEVIPVAFDEVNPTVHEEVISDYTRGCDPQWS
jgi:hypothetical protein